LPRDAYADLSPHAERLAIRVPTSDNRYRRVIVVYLATGRRRSLPRTYATGLVWSANGKRLTYGQRDLVMQLVTIDGKVLGTVEKTVTALPSPDGQQVAYDDEGKLFLWSARSGRTQALVGGDDTEPLAWSPDGHSIFYSRAPVSVVDIRTRRKRVVARFRDGNYADCASISPDGRRIAVPRTIPGYTFGPPDDVSLVVMDRDGTRRRLVPER
jgi:WD40 repeat protein